MKKDLYSRLRSFAGTRTALVIAFVWGLCEGIFFFVVPDVYFGFTALFNPLFGILHGIMSVLGSVTGGIVMHQLTLWDPQTMTHFLSMIPGISPAMINKVSQDLQAMGIQAFMSAPRQGIPYKIYAVESTKLGIGLSELIAITFPARLQRILLVSALVGILGKVFEKNIQKHPKVWGGLYISFWVLFYIFYAYMINQKYP